MSGTPQQNEIKKRRDRMFLDTVQCMLLNSSLPEFLWGEALKIVAYILPKCLVSLFLRLHMSYGHRRNLVFVTSMFGDTRWK